MKEGILRELEEDNKTVTVYQVHYDADNDYNQRNWADIQVPIKKTKTGEELNKLLIDYNKKTLQQKNEVKS